MARTKRKTTTSDEPKSKRAKSSADNGDTTEPKSTEPSPPVEQAEDYSSEATSPAGKKWNIKIVSWNVNGLRACIKKGALEYIEQEAPDIICIQETKCSKEKLPKEVTDLPGYQTVWAAAKQEGYSGVGILSKTKPLSVTYGLGQKEHDEEGRLITAEYPNFYLVNTYVPNSGRGLVRLAYRQTWDTALREHLQKLEQTKPVILCGDLNVSHLEIDLTNPKSNKKNAGFTPEERQGFSTLLEAGFVDSFRELYPEKTGAYTFWTYMGNCRAKNVGWRLDYFVVSKALKENLCDNVIRSKVLGSDHCPITALFAFDAVE